MNLKNEYAFIREAVSDDKTRMFLSMPYYDAPTKTLVSTKGTMMAMLEFGDAVPGDFDSGAGYYLLKEDRAYPEKHADWQFPNYRRVIPENPTSYAPGFKVDLEHDIGYFMAETGLPFKVSLLLSLKKAGKYENWDVWYQKERNILIAKSGRLTAVIAGLQRR